MTPPRPLEVRRLGRVPYREAWALQQALVAERLAGTIPDTLLLLEHDPVITLGRAGSRASLLHDEAALAREGVELVHSDRGGDATWHGPGQVVGYAILDLRPDWKDVRRFVHALEQTMVDACADFGVAVGRVPGAPGVAVDAHRKIGDRRAVHAVDQPPWLRAEREPEPRGLPAHHPVRPAGQGRDQPGGRAGGGRWPWTR
ncbi:MAG: hypothetical protein R3F43_25995 [bacterium]